MARDRLAALGAGAVLVLLVVAAIAPSPHAQLWPDTVRDLSASLELARGRGMPLAGPAINMGPPLGPAWIWLQAPILAAWPTLAATSVYVALVGALKFALLYLLGRMLSGPMMGVCLAAAAAIPSIAVYQWHVFWHPNWVEAAIAASLVLFAAALRTRSIPTLYASAAVLGLAVQLHVAAISYAPLLLYGFARLGARGPSLALHAAGIAAAMLAWFAPGLLAPARPEGEGLRVVLERIGEGLTAFGIHDLLTVLGTAHIEVPLAIGDTYAARAGVGRGAWLALLFVIGAVPAAGVATELATNRDRRRGLLASLIAALLGGWIAATAIRTYTPFYMGYFLLPLSAILGGIGLHRMISSGIPPLRYAGVASLAAVLGAFTATSIGAWHVGAWGHITSRLPLLQDLRHPAEGSANARWIGASARDAMARFVCARKGEVTLHGEWAHALGGSTGLDWQLHCPEHAAKPRILGSSDAGSGWILLTEAETQSLGRKAPLHFRRLAAFPVTSVQNPATGRAIEPDWHHFERLRDRVPLSRTSLSFRTGAGEAVMITRLKPFDSRWENLRVERDGAPAAPALATHNSFVYTSPTEGTRWRIDFDTDAPQWVDVVAF